MAVWIALRFDWWWIIPVAAVGAWNKESFLLIVVTLYPLIRRRNSHLASSLAVAVLCAVCLSVSYPIRMAFAHNPGSTVEPGWNDQLQHFLHLRKIIVSTEETYGIHALRAYSIFPMAMLIWSVRRAWKHLPLAIRQHAKIAAAINIPLYFLFCGAGELRDLSMLYIVFLLVIAVNLNNWIAGSKHPDVNLRST